LTGGVYHLCAGPVRSLTVAELRDLAIEAFDAHGRDARRLPVEIPRLVSLREYDEFVEQSKRGADALLKEVLRALGYFLPHLAMRQFFENQNATRALAESGLRLPPIREYFPRVLRYCLESDFGRLRSAGTEA
jgi:hypothetical protein